MGSSPLDSDCRFCSLVSKSNGEDPIGTAGTCNYWLAVEFKQPWPKEIFKDPRIEPLIPLFKELALQHGISLKPMLIASDREYSVPGFTRLFYYYRPTELFSEFKKQEFLIPETEATSLSIAILKNLMGQPNELSRFEQYKQQANNIREIMVCTHAQIDIACGKFGQPLYRRLRKEYAPKFPEKLRVWQSSHFGGHQFAPTLVDLPAGRLWGHLEPEVLDLLIEKQGPVSELSRFYRGWTGLNKFEQIAEREIWLKEGWEWFNYQKTGKVLRQDKGGIKKYLYKFLQLMPFKLVKLILKEKLIKDASWAEVRIEFTTPDSNISGTYEARVEVNGKVLSSLNSGKEMELEDVKQYRVSHLKKVA